jgi:hypothetical protein
MNKLKGLISYSQSWLQIIEQNNYDEKAEETLNHTCSKLNHLKKIFSSEAGSREAFIIQ